MARTRKPEQKCETPSCKAFASFKGRCIKCYFRIKRNGRAVAVMPQRNPWLKHRPPVDRECAVKGCERPYFSSGYCRRHYMQVWRCGRVTDGEPKPKRPEITGLPTDPETVQLILRRARDAYANAVGVTARMYWRRQVEELQGKLDSANKHHVAVV